MGSSYFRSHFNYNSYEHTDCNSSLCYDRNDSAHGYAD